MEKEGSAEDDCPNDPSGRGKPVGKRGRIVPAGTLGRGRATVTTIGPAQLEAIKRRRAKEKREAEEGASGEQEIQSPEERAE